AERKETIPPLHRSFLSSALQVWSKDERLWGLAAGGSLARGVMDAFSDLDLVLVYGEDVLEAVLADRLIIARKAGALLQGFTGEHVGEPRILICLYGPELLHVDLHFISRSELTRRSEAPLVLWEREGELTRLLQSIPLTQSPQFDSQWIEDRFWVWVH